MTHRERSVVIMKLPEKLDTRLSQRFLNELRNSIAGDRPSIVLDCSNLREMNTAAVLLLLCCLEEAMKRNGDVVLAAVSPDAKKVLKFNDVNGLFRTFETAETAHESFHIRSPRVRPGQCAQPCYWQTSESAA